MFQSSAAASAGAPLTFTPSRRTASKPVRQKASTRNAYERDVARFVKVYGGKIPCTADQLIAFIVLMSRTIAPVTLNRRVMAIQDAHTQAGHASPTTDPRVREAMRWLASGQAPHNLLDKPKGSKAKVPPLSYSRPATGAARPVGRTLLQRMFDAMPAGPLVAHYRSICTQVIAAIGQSEPKRSSKRRWWQFWK